MARFEVSYSFCVLGGGTVVVDAESEEDAKNIVRDDMGPNEAVEHGQVEDFSKWEGFAVDGAAITEKPVTKGWGGN
jgi:hypothetical protein